MASKTTIWMTPKPSFVTCPIYLTRLEVLLCSPPPRRFNKTLYLTRALKIKQLAGTPRTGVGTSSGLVWILTIGVAKLRMIPWLEIKSHYHHIIIKIIIRSLLNFTSLRTMGSFFLRTETHSYIHDSVFSVSNERLHDIRRQSPSPSVFLLLRLTHLIPNAFLWFWV